MLSLALPITSSLTTTAASSIPLVTFDGADRTSFTFAELNDPVMGGQSTGKWSQSSFGIFEGEVVDVPSLSAPGFIKAAADGTFADVSAAVGGSLILRVRSMTPSYTGFRVSFASGTMSPSYACAGGGSIPFSRGCYKAKFSVPAGGNFTDVAIPFASFSDKWSPATGEQTTTCAEEADVCPTAEKLSGIKRLEVWAEGVDGKVHLELDSVRASYDARSLATSTTAYLRAAALTVPVAALESDECPNVDVQPNFNLTEYVTGGKWYIQQQMAVTYLPKTQNYCVTANYSFIDEKKVHVSNYANENEVNGKVYDSDKNLGILGGICADLDDPSQPAKLSVGPCNLPSWIPGARGPYWIVAAGPSAAKYEYALVSGGQPTHKSASGCRTGTGINDSGLWIFTRKAKRDNAIVSKLRAVAQQKGFDLSVLNDVQQVGCEYKPAR